MQFEMIRHIGTENEICRNNSFSSDRTVEGGETEKFTLCHGCDGAGKKFQQSSEKLQKRFVPRLVGWNVFIPLK